MEMMNSRLSEGLFRRRCPVGAQSGLVSVCVNITSSSLSGQSHFKNLTQLVVSFPADINICALHLPEDDYKVYLSITGH